MPTVGGWDFLHRFSPHKRPTFRSGHSNATYRASDLLVCRLVSFISEPGQPPSSNLLKARFGHISEVIANQ